MSAFYNEIDRYPAQWMRNLIEAGHIAPGAVDERSITELDPEELRGYTQAHFFAGIGVWSHALRLAGWSDSAAVWTGSCPCQPFSAAGSRKGHSDERHLWPAWFRLIRECRPAIVLGEQVASKDGLAWLDAVRADMEGEGYAFGAADLCAAGAGAPHIRQRLYFCAYDYAAGRSIERKHRLRENGDAPTGLDADGLREAGERPDSDGRESSNGDVQRSGEHRLLAQDRGPGVGADSGLSGAARFGEHGRTSEGPHDLPHAGRHGGPIFDLHTERAGLEGHTGNGRGGDGPRWLDAQSARSVARAGATRGFWADADWWWGRDGKWRPTQPGVFPLAHGATARVGRLRAYGNAIVAQVAAEFVSAFMECLSEINPAPDAGDLFGSPSQEIRP